MSPFICWVTLRNGCVLRVEIAAIGPVSASVEACRKYHGLHACAKALT